MDVLVVVVSFGSIVVEMSGSVDLVVVVDSGSVAVVVVTSGSVVV